MGWVLVEIPGKADLFGNRILSGNRVFLCLIGISMVWVMVDHKVLTLDPMERRNMSKAVNTALRYLHLPMRHRSDLIKWIKDFQSRNRMKRGHPNGGYLGESRTKPVVSQQNSKRNRLQGKTSPGCLFRVFWSFCPLVEVKWRKGGGHLGHTDGSNVRFRLKSGGPDEKAAYKVHLSDRGVDIESVLPI